MNKIKKIKIGNVEIGTISSDTYISNELKNLKEKLLFHKLLILEDDYLKKNESCKKEILRYMQFLRDNLFDFEMRHNDFVDVWIKEVKPYILDNFPEDKLHGKENDYLYDKLYDVLKFSNLHLD